MSWQLAAFAALFVGLAGGFAWYERTRPDARIVALVATLAAFAALGRIAFAALPNVKPTTDIVLIAGYALGPAPGFVVGAVAGLTSNFFFGQGPWTPWQMAAWGVTGLIGAGLARATGRRLGRWPLALACLAVGFAFTAVQDAGDWVNYSDHSLRQLGVYVGKGLGFDAVHAAGCLIFALAFGPALASSLARFATRLQVTWTRPGAVVGPLIVIALLAGGLIDRSVSGVGVGVGVGVARAAGGGGPRSDGSPGSPVAYLLSAQNSDGGFGGAPGQASTQLFSGWAALGLAAEGDAPGHVSKDGHSVISYLRSGVAGDTDPGSLERTILAVAAGGNDPRSFGGRDLVSALEADIGHGGSVSDQTNLTAFAVLALRAADVPVPTRTLGWLVAQEDSDGGFNFATAGTASDVDDTGAVLEALAAERSPAAARAMRRAVAFIARQQDRDGGFPSSPGAASNAQSTAWAVQGLIAAGRDPAGLRRGGGPSPLGYLESLIAPDGHVRYSRATDQTPVWVTAEAAMALAGKSLPLAAPPRRRHRVIARPAAKHPKPVRQPRVSARRPRRRSPSPAPSGVSMKLATDAAILDALVLAPVGVG